MKLLLICKNSGHCIYRTLSTWPMREIYILINDTTDNTFAEIQRFQNDNPLKFVCVIYRKFIGFGQTRNLLLSHINTEELVMFIDDTYELKQNTFIPDEPHMVMISNKGLEYPRNLCFYGTYRYNTPLLHETIQAPLPDKIIHGIYDRDYAEDSQRRINRPFIKGDIRHIYGKLMSDRNFYEAAELGLSPEPLFRIYQITKNKKWLIAAHQFKKTVVVPMTIGIKEIIKVCYAKLMVLEQLKNKI